MRPVRCVAARCVRNVHLLGQLAPPVEGVRSVPPFDPIAYQAAEACSRLPLVLAVAGGMLAEAGGQLTEDFVQLIQEDHGEVLREHSERLLRQHAERCDRLERPALAPPSPPSGARKTHYHEQEEI